jgi:hypothetical protein
MDSSSNEADSTTLEMASKGSLSVISKAKSKDKNKNPDIKSSKRSSTRQKNKKEPAPLQATKRTQSPDDDDHDEIRPRQNTSQLEAKTLSISQKKSLKSLINDCFGYFLNDIDIDYIQDLYTALPTLRDSWQRIGFNKETQLERLRLAYSKITEQLDNIVEGEDILEDDIKDQIEAHKELIAKLCFDLQITNYKFTSSSKLPSIMDEETHLLAEVKRLDAEKKIRVDNFKRLASVESDLCDRLKFAKTKLVKNIPSECDIAALSARINELKKMCASRLEQMGGYQQRLVELYQDLDVSGSDSFAEHVLYDSVEDLPLSDEDLKKSAELLDDLTCKLNEAEDEIRALRSKIRELWDKLRIENPFMVDIVLNKVSQDSKRKICLLLREEHERCVKIKLENMQKYIENVRSEINSILGHMHMGTKDIHEIRILRETNFTESLLDSHEKLLEELKFDYEENREFYEKCAKWLELWAAYVDFEKKTKDPERLKKRGYNMLSEEKERKTYSSLPRLEDEIKKLSADYHELNNKPLKIFDDPIEEYIYKIRLDHDESKKNQRMEKLIMKENVKRNETRYGSKPATPLALQRAKRKQQETLCQTPNGGSGSTATSRNRSKLQRTDSTMASTPTRLYASNVSTAKTGAGAAQSHLRSKLALGKRKSKTPNKLHKQYGDRMRRSRNKLAADAAAAAQAALENDVTVLSTDTTTKTTSLMSTIMSSTNASSCSNKSSLLPKQTKPTASLLLGSKRAPPLSSSSRYASNYATSLKAIATTGENATGTNTHFGISRMTSTASNTFIEEENLENIECPSDSVISNFDNDNLLQHPQNHHQSRKKDSDLFDEVSARLTDGFKFSMPPASVLNSVENYTEFTSKFSKSIKFGSSSQLAVPKATSTQKTIAKTSTTARTSKYK